MAEKRTSKGAAKKPGTTAKRSTAKGGAKKTGAKKSGAKKGGAAKKPGTTAKRSTAKGGAAKSGAKKGGAAKRGSAKGGKASARKKAGAESPEKSIEAFREALEQSVIAPKNLVMISRERIQEVMDDAVQRGRMTRDDANLTVQRLVRRGRRETDDVLSGLEDLLQSARKEMGGRAEQARKQAQEVVGRVGRRARDTADPALRGADTARRAAGAGPSFPISGYDELTASQIRSRLAKLTPAELRKVRDYEKRNGNRKTILNEIDKRLKA